MMFDDRDRDLSTFRFRKRTLGTFVLVPFVRQGRSIRCQGQLEAAAAQVLTSCPLVADIIEQPLAIWYARHAREANGFTQLREAIS